MDSDTDAASESGRSQAGPGLGSRSPCTEDRPLSSTKSESLELDPAVLYAAHCRRDARMDGRFFTGVTTTGVFCRPVCPAPAPKPAHCRYFLSAAAARTAGFRPCLRCRPEAAPGTAAWRGSEATVSRALRLIEGGALDGDGNVEALAAKLGVGSRHLRRLFELHLGATPRDVAILRRVLFAKQLLDETALPILAFLARWQALPGIGPWTAQLVAMRVLREPDALPASDLGLRQAITPKGEAPRPAAEVERMLDPGRPFRAYAAIRLWSQGAELDLGRPSEAGREPA